ncbi:MAG: acetyl-CoA carboxylase biotin carboxyl carrier protein subunit [Prevotella sp.]|nr:acetyl-CoA carboxylase biotin carboxyl carrier protein subunit [Prevotella sp.]MCM1476243.1 acetyl-CoA carboxylase biotin carboxyl carrier protein subunit [Muribaculaceae bacterium]
MEFKVQPGDTVKVGDTILVYEAMKMENNLVSDRDGVIAKFLIEEGDVMATDQPIVQFGGAGAKAAAPKPKPAAPKPVAPKPAAKADDVKVDVPPVHPVDINRAIASVDGGTSGVNPVPAVHHSSDKGAQIRLSAGTSMEINVAPDGGISIRIYTGK